MKASLNGRIPTIMLLLAIGIVLPSCDKEENLSYFRVTTINNYINDLFKGGSRYIYEDNEVWQILTRYNNGDSSRIEYSYPEADKAIESYYYFNGFSWTYDGKIEYVYQDKYLSKLIKYDYEEPEIMIEILYENNDLKEELVSEYHDGKWNESAKITYTYSEGKLAQTMLYKNISGIWLIDGKEEVTTHGDSLNIIIEYDYHQEDYYEVWKYEYFYNDDRIIATTAYHNLEGSKWILKSHQIYTYNENGDLSSRSDIESGITKRAEYLYENTEGNLGQFIYRGGGATGSLFYSPMIQLINPVKEYDDYKKWQSAAY